VANLFHHGADPTFADLYRTMSELELQDLLSEWHSLIPEACSALAAEFATRSLEFIEPPPPAGDIPPEFRDLTTIRRYRDLSEALVARAVIESAGIFCFLKDENLVRLDWQVSNFIGGIRLQVGAADVDEAKNILSQPIPNEISIPDQPGFIQPRCPRCTSTDISWERQGRKAALASLYLFSLPLPRGSESWHCNSCDLRWIDDEPEESASNDNASPDSQR
jgi:Putative prokaryotic signal transducing protein